MEVIKEYMVRRRRRLNGLQEGYPFIYVDSQKEGRVPVLCNGAGKWVTKVHQQQSWFTL